MSTYNGKQYVREQLDSIIGQDYPWVEILIRDDGSTDGTVQILEEYAREYSNVSYYEGKNLGVIDSFFHLMNQASRDCTYYALADQDDVWKPEKIRIAVEHIKKEKSTRPLLYCSATTLVDADLNLLPDQMKKPSIRVGFGNALVENRATGCTCVMNQSLLEYMKQQPVEDVIMHDWWLYLAANCYGKVIYDQHSYILYRQHGNNQVGSTNTYWKEIKNRVHRFRGNKGKLRRQAISFQKIFDRKKENELLNDFISYKQSWSNRIRMVRDHRIYRQRSMDDFIFRVLFLLGRV